MCVFSKEGKRNRNTFCLKKKSGFVIELVVSKWIHQVVKDLRKRTLRGLYMVRTGLGNTELHLKNKS